MAGGNKNSGKDHAKVHEIVAFLEKINYNIVHAKMMNECESGVLSAGFPAGRHADNARRKKRAAGWRNAYGR